MAQLCTVRLWHCVVQPETQAYRISGRRYAFSSFALFAVLDRLPQPHSLPYNLENTPSFEYFPIADINDSLRLYQLQNGHQIRKPHPVSSRRCVGGEREPSPSGDGCVDRTIHPGRCNASLCTNGINQDDGSRRLDHCNLIGEPGSKE